MEQNSTLQQHSVSYKKYTLSARKSNNTKHCKCWLPLGSRSLKCSPVLSLQPKAGVIYIYTHTHTLYMIRNS
jgi:hypothetical protein